MRHNYPFGWLCGKGLLDNPGSRTKGDVRVRSSNEPLVILDFHAEVQNVSQQVELAAVEETRAQGAAWSDVAEALNRTRQAVEQRFA